jgi:competence protein ComEC
MSYGAILGIVLVMPVVQKKKCSGLYTSISVNLMLLPILLWFYYEISAYSVILNLLIVPMISVVLGFGMIGSGLLLVVRPAGVLCLSVCDVLLDLCELCNLFGKRLPFARIVAGQPKACEIVIYYLVLGVILLMLYKKKKKRHVLWLLLIIPMLLLITEQRDGLQVTMVDVGQGDCIYIEEPGGQTFLIDGGSSDVDQVGKYRLEPFLKSQGVDSLDYVFLTHGDSDHYSGIEEMLGRQEMGVKISCLVLPALYMQDEDLCTLANMAKEEDVKVAVMKTGQFIRNGEFQITCLQPDEGDRDLEGNAASMVLDVRYQSFSMLCTGDVEEEGEVRMLQKLPGEEYDVLKVAHHGSKYSGCEEFLSTVCPEIALISAGKDNRYGHPHRETIQRLKNVGCKIYQTMEGGAITLWSDGKSLTISTFSL